MSRKGFPSDKQDQFAVRLPDGMRDRIKIAAAASNRSMNAEIIDCLEEKYPAPAPSDIDQEVMELFNQLEPSERKFLLNAARAHIKERPPK